MTQGNILKRVLKRVSIVTRSVPSALLARMEAVQTVLRMLSSIAGHVPVPLASI